LARGKRALKRFVQRTRKKRRSGVPIRRIFLEVGAERKRKMVGVKGKPFLEGKPEEAFERAKKRVLPKVRKVPPPRGGKKKLVDTLFSSRGANLGLIVIKPALLGKSGSIRAFLRELGCELVYSKPIMLTKQHLVQVYPHAIKEHPTFAMHALDLLSGPSRVIIFKHVPKEQYIKHSRFLRYLKRTNPKKFGELVRAVEKATTSQEVFNILFKGGFERIDPGTLRGDIIYPALRELGFGKREVSGLAEIIDALGYYQYNLARDPNFKTYYTMSGLHIPGRVELMRDANAFLGLRDLRAIKKKI